MNKIGSVSSESSAAVTRNASDWNESSDADMAQSPEQVSFRCYFAQEVRKFMRSAKICQSSRDAFGHAGDNSRRTKLAQRK
jgi:hypothetical protein